MQQSTSNETGVECPAPMTRAALVALRNAGDLLTECHYVVTDYNRGTVLAAEILLHAVDENTLSMDAEVKTTFDNVAWNGRYDIDTNRLQSLQDNLGNEVSGETSVDTFPWGVTAVTENKVFEAAVNYTAGTMTDNLFHGNAVITMNSGVMQRNTVGHSANVTLTNGDFRENRVDGDATVTVTTTGDVDNNTFGSNSISSISGAANLDTVSVAKAANLTLSGGSLYDTVIEMDATVTISSGSNYENHFGNSTIYNQVGTGYIRNSRVDGNSTLTNGNVNITNTRFWQTSYNTTGSTGAVSNSDIRDCNLNACQNVASFTVNYCDFSANSQMAVTGATRVYLRYSSMQGYGRILVSANRTLNCEYTGFRDYSYVQVTNGTLNVYYTTVHNVSYVRSTTTGTNRIDRCHVSSGSNLRFSNTATNCRIYYSKASSGSFIDHRGSSTGCYFYYCEVSSNSEMFSNNSVNLRGYYNSATADSQIYSQNVTATHYIYYCACNGHGYIRFENATAGRIYAVSCAGQGLLRFRGSTAAGRIYYSSFNAYYYLYGENWTATRTGLHGYGRRTYTVTNPPNGTFTQNF